MTTSVFCLLIEYDGEPLGPLFPVRIIKADDTIRTLREEAWKKRRKTLEGAGVDPHELRLYRCTHTTFDFDTDDSELLKTEVRAAFSDGKCEYLRPGQKLSDVKLEEEETVFVRVPHKLPADEDEEGTRTRKERKHMEEPGREPLGVRRLREEIGALTPSTLSALAYPAKFRKITGPKHAISCNRPPEPPTIPIALLDEHFGDFLDRKSQPPSLGATQILNSMTRCVCDWYADERSRSVALKTMLMRTTMLVFCSPFDEGSTGGASFPPLVAPAVILECIDGTGFGKEQATLLYCHYLQRAWDQGFLNSNTRFPCLLLVVTGTLLGFCGALWNGEQAVVEPLTPMFDLTTDLRDGEQRATIASSLDAFLETTGRLQKHYNNVMSARRYDDDVHEARKYPYKTSYVEDGHPVTFTYDSRLNGSKLVFYATPDTVRSVDDELVVKFTRQYGEDVHRFLAENGLAPRLREVSVIPGGWRAVVMDRSHYEPLFDIMLTKDQFGKVERALRRAVELLCEAGFVHGNIRTINVFVDKLSVSSDDVKMHLIDFDWAGRLGEVRYPLDINRETMWRPEGVSGGRLITHEHDMEMIEYMFR